MSHAVRCRASWQARVLLASMLCVPACGPFAAAGPASPFVAVGAAEPDAAAPFADAARPLALAEAERLLVQSSPQMQAARLALEAARADVVTALEAPNPQFSWNSTMMNFHDGLGAGAPWDKRVDSVFRIDQQIERGGKRELRGKAAMKGEAAARADVEEALRTSTLAVDNAYYDLKTAQEALQIASDLASLQRQSLEVARLRFGAGAASDVDVAGLQVELARAEADLADATTAKRAAQIALAQLVGLPSDRARFEATDDWPAVTAGYSAEGAVNQRPDVRAAHERLDRAEASIALARAQLTHDVTVGAQYERFPQPDVGPNTWGVGFSIPIFLRNRFEGEIARAGTDRRLAEQQLRQTQLAAQADRELATAQLEGAVQRVRRFQEEVVTQARKAADAEEYAYSRGSLALTDLLDARRSLQAVLLDTLNARATYAKALAAWKAATSVGAAGPAGLAITTGTGGAATH